MPQSVEGGQARRTLAAQMPSQSPAAEMRLHHRRGGLAMPRLRGRQTRCRLPEVRRLPTAARLRTQRLNLILLHSTFRE